MPVFYLYGSVWDWAQNLGPPRGREETMSEVYGIRVLARAQAFNVGTPGRQKPHISELCFVYTLWHIATHGMYICFPRRPELRSTKRPLQIPSDSHTILVVAERLNGDRQRQGDIERGGYRGCLIPCKR